MVMIYRYTKKVYIGSFLKTRLRIRSQTSGSGFVHKGPDPAESKFAALF
jgi:hypothetical protein